MEEGARALRPMAEEVIAKLKDDGDFDSLRLKIIRKVKENEELRNTITTGVQQSEMLNQDDSENLKPRHFLMLSIKSSGYAAEFYSQHLTCRRKIMGQISDEVWKVVRNDSTKEDIRGPVEPVHDRIVNPKPKEEDHHHASPAKAGTVTKWCFLWHQPLQQRKQSKHVQ